MEKDLSVPQRMRERTTLSFELSPPKTEDGMGKLLDVLSGLARWDPDWISVTCGALGTDRGCQTELLTAIAERNISAVAHYTCIHVTRQRAKREIGELLSRGIDHFLILRGDLVPGERDTGGDFAHASDLVAFLKDSFAERVTLGCAGMPEGHMESADFTQDVRYLKLKQDLGCEFTVTQLCFDMEQFARWQRCCGEMGVTLPVAAGVMPVLERDRCLRHCLSVNGCAIPTSLARHITRCYSDPVRFREEGMDYTARQIREYLALGVGDVHLYCRNDLPSAEEILRRTGLYKVCEK